MEIGVRFLQVHLSMKRGGAHSAVHYLKDGLMSIGHQCDVSSENPIGIPSLDYDLILFHSFSSENFPPYHRFLGMCRDKGLPHAIVMHDYWPLCHQTNMVMVGNGLMRCEGGACDTRRCGWGGARQPIIDGIRDENIVCFTNRSATIFKDGGFKRVHVIPHGIDMSLFSPPETPRGVGPRVLFTNAWGRKAIKGYHHWEWIKRNSNEGVLFDQVMGEVKNTEMPRVYSSSDVTLFLSLWEETFGLTVIESLACGTPVISYPIGVSPDVIDDGVNGFIVQDSNPRTALARMSDLFGMSRDDMDLMRGNCRRSVEGRFSNISSAERYVSLAKYIGGTM